MSLVMAICAGFAVVGGPWTAPQLTELPGGLALAAARQPEEDGAHQGRRSRQGQLRDEALAAIKRGDFAKAERVIREGRKTRSANRRDAWTLIEARLELERGDHAKAGLLAMRIVLLRPSSGEFAAALYWTGRAYEGLGRPNKSIQLYEECIDHKTAGDGLVRAARGRIRRLRAPDSP